MATLYIGIPTYGKSEELFSIDSGWELIWQIGRHHPEISNIWVSRDVRTYRQMARLGIIQAALEANADYLLMLDNDHVFDGAAFSKLWAAAQADPLNVTMIGGLYFTRSQVTAPCIFHHTDQGTTPIFYYPEDAIMEVDVIGFGFQLFRTEVFRRVNGPWFDLGIGTGEDAAFCTRWRAAGGKVHVHTGVKIGHLLETPVIIDEAYYKEQLPIMEAQASGKLETYSLYPTPEGELRSSVESMGSRPWWRPWTRRRWRRDAGNDTGGLGHRGSPRGEAALPTPAARPPGS